MPYEVRDMSGTLFPERDKKSEKAPDYTGTVQVRGETLRIAGWKKSGRNGTFLSLAFSEPRGERGEHDQRPRDTDDSIPF